MALRRGGCFTPPAMLAVVGFWLILSGKMAEADQTVKYGLLCLVGAVVVLGIVCYVRWQGWTE